MKKILFPAAAAAATGLLCLSCIVAVGNKSVETSSPSSHASAAKEMLRAIALLAPASGSGVSGTVSFTSTADGAVMVVANVSGLSPNGVHAFHVHEFGDCSAPDGSSAGSHFNPGGHQHAAPDAKERHMGDLGNLRADAEGRAHLEFKDGVLKLEGPQSIIGKAVIVHAKADDFVTQPTGNAGGRVACGVIGVAKP